VTPSLAHGLGWPSTHPHGHYSHELIQQATEGGFDSLNELRDAPDLSMLQDLSTLQPHTEKLMLYMH
jgi:hypothetical protein